MPRAVRMNYELLQAIVKLNKHQRTSLIRVADKSLVTAICECFLNILNGNVPLTKEVKNKLVRYKQSIRSLADSKGLWQSKRLLLVKKAEKLVPLVIATVLDYLEDESRKEDGTYFTGSAATVEHAAEDRIVGHSGRGYE